MAQRPWSPILDGELAVAGELALDELVAALAVNRSAEAGPTLSQGAGDALLWAYLERARPGRGHGERAQARLERIARQLAEQDLRPSLHAGFVGTAWVFEHLAALDDEDDANEAIDAALGELLAQPSWPDEHDLITGLAGLGVYALERCRWPSARGCLERIVAHLEVLATPRDTGLAWLSLPELLPGPTRAEWPRGYFNYGVAHGAPAVIVVLAGAVQAGVAAARARPLLDGALRWLWAGRRDDPTGSAFYRWEQDGVGFDPARLAWCHGDAGVAAAVHAAACAIGDGEWAERALAVARRSTARTLADSGVVDGCLCHGSAGLALMYARLAHATGEPIFADAARRWYAHLLDQRQPGAGIGGFVPGMRDDTSLMLGATGIALALLAGLSAVEPVWDRLLAVSLPPAPDQPV
jgi:lantibiotic modifying enzyme